MSTIKLDELDYQIIGALRRDGRQANTEIARRVGTTEAKVRNRIGRLVKAGIIQIAALVDMPRLGFELDVLIGIHCEPNRVTAVGREIAAMEGVRYIACVTGQYDLWVAACFRSRADLFTFLTERIGNVPGVRKMETLHVLQVLKREYDYFRDLVGPGPEDPRTRADGSGNATAGTASGQASSINAESWPNGSR